MEIDKITIDSKSPWGGSDTVKQKKHKSCSKGVSKMSLVFDDIPHHPLTFT